LPSDDEDESGSGSEESETESSESEEEEEKVVKSKGVSGLIELENPNRVAQKTRKLADLDKEDGATGGKPQLSRRERLVFTVM